MVVISRSSSIVKLLSPLSSAARVALKRGAAVDLETALIPRSRRAADSRASRWLDVHSSCPRLSALLLEAQCFSRRLRTGADQDLTLNSMHRPASAA